MALVLILVVGRDPELLSSRYSVLRSAGYAVTTAVSVSESMDLFQNGDFDLVLLCHSVPTPDRDRIIRFIRSTGSHTPICTVTAASQDFRAALDERTLSSRPQDLIKELAAVLAAAPRGIVQAGFR